MNCAAFIANGESGSSPHPHTNLPESFEADIRFRLQSALILRRRKTALTPMQKLL
jgi:hypothetical protein